MLSSSVGLWRQMTAAADENLAGGSHVHGGHIKVLFTLCLVTLADFLPHYRKHPVVFPHRKRPNETPNVAKIRDNTSTQLSKIFIIGLII